MKILILKPSSLGDVVQALPVLRLLKQHQPKNQIYWWLSEDLLSLLEGDLDLTGVIPFHRRRLGSPWHWGEIIASVRIMRAHAFDWVIDLQSLARSALVAWFVRGQFTIGLDDPREGAPAFYDQRVARPSFHTHAVDWYLQVLSAVGIPVHRDFDWLPVRPHIARQVQQKWPVSAARWILLQPGARWPNKRWPIEWYADLVRRLAGTDPTLHFAVMGSAAERPLGEALAGMDPQRCLNLAGQTSLPEMVEWIRQSQLLVTNDTGPMHIAAALGKPVVALFGPTEPRRTGPYGQIQQVLQAGLPCSPCMRAECRYHQPLECLRAITPERVALEVQRRLFAACQPPP